MAPEPALSKVFHVKFRNAMSHAGLLDTSDPSVWKEPWVVRSQTVDDGSAALTVSTSLPGCALALADVPAHSPGMKSDAANRPRMRHA